MDQNRRIASVRSRTKCIIYSLKMWGNKEWMSSTFHFKLWISTNRRYIKYYTSLDSSCSGFFFVFCFPANFWIGIFHWYGEWNIERHAPHKREKKNNIFSSNINEEQEKMLQHWMWICNVCSKYDLNEHNETEPCTLRQINCECQMLDTECKILYYGLQRTRKNNNKCFNFGLQRCAIDSWFWRTFFHSIKRQRA